MLTQIYISNLVTIQSLDLELCHHTTVITGETGAGKSIMIDAIELALGGRSNSDMIRTGHDKADIHLTFDLSRLPEAVAWLQQYDLNQHTECIIRRTLYRDGRSRSYINGQPITLQLLREFGEFLIQIHGQHEHQALLKTDFQRKLLDRFAGHAVLVDTVSQLADEWRHLNNEIRTLQRLTDEHNARGDFLKFQLRELDELNIGQDEFQQLDLEHKQLAHAGDLLQSLNFSLSLLADNEENNAMHILNQALQSLESVQHIDPKITSWVDSLKNAILQVSDAEDDLRRYLDHVDLDPERLQWLESRISLIFDLARKHKVGPQELYDLRQKMVAEYNQLESSDARLAELHSQLDTVKQKYLKAANQLSDSRSKAAKQLSKDILDILQQLALSKAEFHIQFEKDNDAIFHRHGLEKIQFLIKTNAGQSLQSLAKVASGGELSRISLAIHMATAFQHATSTLIFDEVDVGVGGGTAEIVGKLLRNLGEKHQVFCITHQPQVAAQGHNHLLVSKSEKNNMTQSEIKLLTEKEKIQEIARMLGGMEITKKTLDHAREMLEKTI